MKGACLITLLLLTWQSKAQTKKAAVNYLGIQDALSLQKNTYQLAWSSHPESSFFKQEYLAAGDDFPNYNKMLSIDFAVTESNIDQLVAAKMRELEQLKRPDLDVKFEILVNSVSGEKILDCLITQTAPNDKNSLAERDIFRFKTIKAKSGQRGIILLAASTRKYGKEIKPFLAKLKTEKQILIAEVAKFPMPEPNISKQF
ncbi:hypothetical protein FDK13_23630 [Dyadobacter frigoris]|uniref:DUF4252 domain-containing protein n=2 Tax=Dyadobacter frigoris TaxID=2576211 RepID=A0A4U6D002_9BACT|nr:hypothetical protein FDK13_23630 [Dyadobacter frigoris]